MVDKATGNAQLVAYKAGLAAKRKGGKKRSNAYYFPIGRTIATFAGVLKMINARDVQMAFKNLENGDLPGFSSRMQKAMSTSMKEKAEGIGMISTGVILGKALDHMKSNPRIKMGKYGVKLV